MDRLFSVQIIFDHYNHACSSKPFLAVCLKELISDDILTTSLNKDINKDTGLYSLVLGMKLLPWKWVAGFLAILSGVLAQE